ncbi:MAG: ASCH domain-containing protein [Thermoproteus sp.]
MLSRRYLEDLLAGKKRATIRLGRVKRDHEAIIHSGGKIVAVAEILDVRYKRVAELDDFDAQLDGYKDVRELKKALRRHYPQIKDGDVVSIIIFGNVKKVDMPEGSDYLGLKPNELAELALKRLELKEEERRILGAVAKYKSIRRAALKLFGSVEKRKVIRRLLKRVARELSCGDNR